MLLGVLVLRIHMSEKSPTRRLRLKNPHGRGHKGATGVSRPSATPADDMNARRPRYPFAETASACIPQPLKLGLQPNSAAKVPKTDFGKLAAFLTATEMAHDTCHGQGSQHPRQATGRHI